MAHEIEVFEDGSAAFASARQDAWHRLGVVTTDCMTAEEVMRTAHLGGWNVRKEELVTTATGTAVTDRFATVRDNPVTGRVDYLGVVGNGYSVVQNEECCELLNLLVDESGAHFETAGSLRGGRDVFVTMKLPQTMLLAGHDGVELYLAMLNAHDGSAAARVIVSPVRIVCANTQRMALRQARSSYTFRHTAGVKARIAEARQALGLTWRYLELFQAEAERMLEAELTRAEFHKIIEDLWPMDEEPSERQVLATMRREAALDDLWSSPTQENITGTRWGGLQVVTEYLDHVAPAKTDDVRATRVLTGEGVNALKQQAFELLRV